MLSNTTHLWILYIMYIYPRPKLYNNNYYQYIYAYTYILSKDCPITYLGGEGGEDETVPVLLPRGHQLHHGPQVLVPRPQREGSLRLTILHIINFWYIMEYYLENRNNYFSWVIVTSPPHALKENAV